MKLPSSKRCGNCLKVKSATDFYPRMGGKYLMWECKRCNKTKTKEWLSNANPLLIRWTQVRTKGMPRAKVLMEYFSKISTCSICGEPISPAEYTLDHITPTSKGGTHALNNLAVAHFRCNTIKNDLTRNELIEFCRRVLSHLSSPLHDAEA